MNTLISTLSDLLLFAATVGAAAYCLILSRRLTRLNSIDKGLGGAIAVLSAQVDDLTKVLDEAKAGSEAAAERLSNLTVEAESLANNIEELLAVSHDIDPSAVEFGSRRGQSGSGTPMFRHNPAQEAAE